MSNEFFDNLFLPDDDGLPMDGLDLLEDMEQQKENILMELFELPQFFHNVFFACALTERGRKRLRELEAASPELFLTEPFLLLDTYEALYKTGMPEIDRCVKQLLILFHNETRGDGNPEQTLTVVKAAYPKLYGSCKSAGDAVSIGQLYQKLANVIPEEQENGICEDKYFLRPVRDFNDFIEEGAELMHCVASSGYFKYHVQGSSYIFLIRKKREPNNAYYTMEFDPKKKEVIQLRGYKDCSPTKQIVAFRDEWLAAMGYLDIGEGTEKEAA